MEPSATKLCNQCNCLKSLDEFSKGRAICKICKRAYNKSYYYSNRPEILLQKQEYGKRKSSVISLKNKERYSNNKEKYRLKNAMYYDKHKEDISKQAAKRKSKPRNKLRALCKEVAWRANKKNLAFDLDETYLRELLNDQNGKCAITQTLMSTTQGEGRKLEALSLDRINATKGYVKGYVKGNVRFVCDIVNTMKMRLTDQELYSWTSKITNGLKEKGLVNGE